MESYKIYLQNHDSTTKEIRRFKTNKVEFDFKEFCQKMKGFFSDLRDGNFSVSWKDFEGDEIIISCNEEFKLATESMHGDICRLYIKLTSQNQEPSTSQSEKVIHPSISCDSCNGNIVGYRYKCIQCEDYDLCSQCEAKNLHSNHYMIRLPRPLLSHSQNLVYSLRKFLKKNKIHSNKKHSSHEHSRRKKKCYEFTLNYNVMPWLEAFMPYLDSFIETGEEPCSTNADPSNQASKQTVDKNSKAFVRVYQSDNDGVDVVVEVDTDKPETSSANHIEKKQECKEDISTNKSACNPFPGKGRKLHDDAEDDKVSVSDTASVTSEDSITKATVADEWTIVDKHESSEISHASSVLSNLNEAGEKHVLSAPTSSPERSSSGNRVYPVLSEQQKVYHSNPRIQTAVESLIEMGFSNESGLLTYLLEAENGNINKVLDILYTSKI